ncbi:hypothetical protein OG455_18090 [Kitasatospora sp. NBC_01287]|uniref:hypothetical protein n=1 Tax=Kitasatospora sp. NBC_01287 TaxID=2903573 RepID=UPI00225737F8|nr:hypothetical protein [Kitasatospora sp. NBC_01287]MCX4747411.1 hypothetical protein [Kitasatospora sp. NBC_01287]
MIAATASSAERLPTARIDEVLLHQQPQAAPAEGPADATARRGPRRRHGDEGPAPVSSAAAG